MEYLDGGIAKHYPIKKVYIITEMKATTKSETCHKMLKT